MKIIELLVESQYLVEYDTTTTVEKNRIKLDPFANELNLSVEELVLALEEADPSRNKQYMMWILRMFLNRKMKLEEVQEVNQLLATFTSYKNRLPQEQRDINRMSVDDLRKVIADNDPTNANNNSTSKGIFPVFPETKILYNGVYGQLAIPETEEAAIELGKGTKWCTSATESENFFDDYSSDETPLYIWRDKNGEKYQFWVGTSDIEFKNSRDFDLNTASPGIIEFFIKSHPVLSKFFKKLTNIITARFPYLLPAYVAASNNAISIPRNKQIEDLIITKKPHYIIPYAKHIIKGRWPEAEPRVMKDPILASQYAMSIIKGRWLEAEHAIMKNSYATFKYAANVINGRWPEAEPIILKDTEAAFRYAVIVINGRWPEAEPVILQSPMTAVSYAEEVIKGRWPEAERAILQSPSKMQAAISYASDVIKDRWPEAEPVIMRYPDIAESYAEEVIKDRWPEAEPVIMRYPYAALAYSLNIIKGRWPDAEKYIKKAPDAWSEYTATF